MLKGDELIELIRVSALLIHFDCVAYLWDLSLRWMIQISHSPYYGHLSTTANSLGPMFKWKGSTAYSLQILGLGFILKTFLKCRKYQPRFSYNKRYQEHWRYVEWLLTHTLSIRCFFVPLSAVHWKKDQQILLKTEFLISRITSKTEFEYWNWFHPYIPLSVLTSSFSTACTNL